MQMRLNSEELSALEGLPFFVRCVYMFAIRPHMDYTTGVVGISRRISWQSMAEALYVEPHQGVKDSGTPTKARLRRAVEWLEKEHIIEDRGDGKRLVFACLHASADQSVSKKPGKNPAQTRHSQPGTEPGIPEVNNDAGSLEIPGTEPGKNPASPEPQKPGIPPESGNREEKEGGKPPLSRNLDAIERILAHLNEQTGRRYKPVKTNRQFIAARLQEGFSEHDCCAVIDRQIARWMGTEMEGYLRPATLFNATKFAQYHGEVGTPLPERLNKQEALEARNRAIGQDWAGRKARGGGNA